MELTAIVTDQAPKAIGPYAQAVRVGNMLYTSGQLGMDLNGNLAEGGIVPQTEQVFHNLKAILLAAGTSLDNVVKATVFIADMNQFTIVNEIYAAHFGSHKPARSTVEVSRLPKDALIENELTAAINK